MSVFRVLVVVGALLTFGQVCAQENCCVGLVGDANGSNEDMPTIGDICVMIDALYITGECIESGQGANIRCLAEADCNQSGGCNPTCEDITISDITCLIADVFYIPIWPLFGREECLVCP